MATHAAKRTQAITSEPIGLLMFRLTVPMVLGIVSMMLLGIVDAYFVSMLGTTELAAVSFALPITQIIISVALGVGMAISAVTSRLLGEGRHGEAARLITDGKMLTLLISLLVMCLGFLCENQLFRAMGASAEVMPLAVGYLNVWLLAAPFFMVFVSGSTALRALGDIKSSAFLTALLAGLNVVLDPLLIFGIGPFPRLEVMGAAIASAIAAFITWICFTLIFVFREKMVDFRFPRAAHLMPNWQSLLSIAIPAIGANVMTPLAATVMTAIIAAQGSAAVAGFGVGSRVESLALIVVFALSSTLPMFIGQNIGAGKKERAYRALMGGLRFTLIFQLLIYILLALFASVISVQFSQDPVVREVIRQFLYILPLTYGAHGVVILSMVSLNMLHRPRTALMLTIVRLMLLYLPLAFAGSLIAGTIGLFMGAAIGNIIAGIFAFRVIIRECDRQGIGPETGMTKQHL